MQPEIVKSLHRKIYRSLRAFYNHMLPSMATSAQGTPHDRSLGFRMKIAFNIFTRSATSLSASRWYGTAMVWEARGNVTI